MPARACYDRHRSPARPRALPPAAWSPAIPPRGRAWRSRRSASPRTSGRTSRWPGTLPGSAKVPSAVPPFMKRFRQQLPSIVMKEPRLVNPGQILHNLPPMSNPIYLDHAAATPLDPRVFEAMRPFLEGQFANPSSLYRAARETRRAVEQSRHSVAAILGAKPTEIVFTSGGTEGDNLAVQGVLRAHPGAHWVTTAIEHDAV